MRLQLAADWLKTVCSGRAEIAPLAGDASFRRYFRVRCNGQADVLMDAPPDKENTAPFLQVRDWLQASGVRVPQLRALDRAQGFLLLEDFGDITWSSSLQEGGDVEPLIDDAIAQLHRLQGSSAPDLPLFDVARMQRECDLYLDWYLPRVAGYQPGDEEREAFHAALRPSLEEIAALPRVPVHLDFHSRNLMLPDGGLPLGVIDFQDAVLGPVTYDLASLLYDCYQDYPETERRRWSERCFNGLSSHLQQQFDGVEAWHRAVRLTALQRHIKATGIFARLAYRDGKLQFLDEIPLTRRHMAEEMPLFRLHEVAVRLLSMPPEVS